MHTFWCDVVTKMGLVLLFVPQLNNLFSQDHVSQI